AERGRRTTRGTPGAVDRVDDVLSQHVLDVHQQQLLVLLLVVQAQFDESSYFWGWLLAQQRGHRLVDPATVLTDLRHRWTGDDTAGGALLSGTDRLVVGVEVEPVRRLHRLVAGQV